LSERPEDMAFFDERIEKGLIAKLQGNRRFGVRAHGFTGEAIAVLGRAKGEVRIPGAVGDRPAVRARTLSDRAGTRSRPVIVMNYPKGIKAFYMRLNDDDKTVAAMERAGAGDRRDHTAGASREERLSVLDDRGCAPESGRGSVWTMVVSPIMRRYRQDRAACGVRAGVRRGRGLCHGFRTCGT